MFCCICFIIIFGQNACAAPKVAVLLTGGPHYTANTTDVLIHCCDLHKCGNCGYFRPSHEAIKRQGFHCCLQFSCWHIDNCCETLCLQKCQSCEIKTKSGLNHREYIVSSFIVGFYFVTYLGLFMAQITREVLKNMQ